MGSLEYYGTRNATLPDGFESAQSPILVIRAAADVGYGKPLVAISGSEEGPNIGAYIVTNAIFGCSLL